MQKTIALIGVSTLGHHIAFMRLFADSLLKLEYNVLILFPENTPIHDWVIEKNPEKEGNYYYYPYEEAKYKVKNWGRFNNAVATRKKWKHLAKTIKMAAKQHEIAVDFVYFSWLDSYLENYLHPVLINSVFPYDWSGLYFHPFHLRWNTEGLRDKASFSEIDIALTSKRCKNITVHDEGIISKFSKRIGKKVILFPEIADDTAPNMQLESIKAIQEQANGRAIVVIAGILGLLNGLHYFIDLAQNADSTKYFFVFAGPKQLIAYTPEKAQEVENFFETSPENCYFNLDYIQEGANFNAFINVADILFLVYQNFASSSNRLTKAAIFKKYVLAQNTFCVGEDVEKYGLGVTIEAGNTAQALQGLELLRHKIQHEPFPHEKFEFYRQLHSIERLKEKFQEVLANL